MTQIENQKPVKRATEVTEPRAVATGCELSSWEAIIFEITKLLRELNPTSPRYRSGFCIGQGFFLAAIHFPDNWPL
jgi:hypothetical protein